LENRGKGKLLGRWNKRVTTDARRYYYRKEMHRKRGVDEVERGRRRSAGE
jgi:hypothetical protein